jgi:hypothetical protein
MIAIIGNYMLTRPKLSTIEVVAPKEAEEETKQVPYGEPTNIRRYSRNI